MGADERREGAGAKDREMALSPGAELCGRYRIERVIGRGGMSVVYLAGDRRTGKQWAVKEVRREGEDDGGPFIRSFAAETRILCSLNHPSLPRIADVFEDGGRLYMVMDYLEGETLKEAVGVGGPMEEGEAVRIIIALAEVLSYLHTRRPPIIYRDMKPGNVMRCRDGRIVLFDFGIAREYRLGASEDTCLLGTPGYAAPEQFGGGQTDARTDVYGLGATLFFLLTGAEPPRPPAPMISIRRINPSLSTGLDRIISRAACHDPAGRFRSCAEFRDAAAAYIRLEDRQLAAARRKVSAFALFLGLGVFSLGAVIFFAGQSVRDRRARYLRAVAEAGERAAESLSSGTFDAQVLSAYLRAAELQPSGKEAYLELMRYCESMDETDAGLAAVCGRIEAGAEGGKIPEKVLAEAGWLLFRAASREGGRRGDYRRAADFFDRLDRERYPGARAGAALGRALGSFSGDVDWKETAFALGELIDGNSAASDVSSVRGLLLAAELCLGRSTELEKVSFEPLKRAEEALEAALSGAEALMQAPVYTETGTGGTGQEAAILRREILKAFGDLCMRKPGTADRAAAYFGQLSSGSADPAERRLWQKRRADALASAGETETACRIYEKLLTDEPEDPDPYLALCSLLLQTGRTERAAEIFERAKRECPGMQSGANYSAVAARLRDHAQEDADKEDGENA